MTGVYLAESETFSLVLPTGCGMTAPFSDVRSGRVTMNEVSTKDSAAEMGARLDDPDAEVCDTADPLSEPALGMLFPCHLSRHAHGTSPLCAGLATERKLSG